MMGRTAPKGAFLNVTSYGTFDVKFATNHTATFLVCQQRENHLFSTIYLIAHREKCLCYLPSEPLIWTLCFWLWESSPPIMDGIFWCLLFFVVGIDNLFVMEWNGMEWILCYWSPVWCNFLLNVVMCLPSEQLLFSKKGRLILSGKYTSIKQQNIQRSS